MLDRFDMVIEVPEVSGQLLLDRTPGEATSAVARRVADVQGFAARRAPAPEGENDTPLRDVSPDATSLLELAIEKKSLSARGFHRVLRVARTIADLQQQTVIERGHLAESLGYRAMPLLA
jgi:magnesium chelatase family protein